MSTTHHLQVVPEGQAHPSQQDSPPVNLQHRWEVDIMAPSHGEPEQLQLWCDKTRFVASMSRDNARLLIDTLTRALETPPRRPQLATVNNRGAGKESER